MPHHTNSIVSQQHSNHDNEHNLNFEYDSLIPHYFAIFVVLKYRNLSFGVDFLMNFQKIYIQTKAKSPQKYENLTPSNI